MTIDLFTPIRVVVSTTTTIPASDEPHDGADHRIGYPPTVPLSCGRISVRRPIRAGDTVAVGSAGTVGIVQRIAGEHAWVWFSFGSTWVAMAIIRHHSLHYGPGLDAWTRTDTVPDIAAVSDRLQEKNS